MVGSTTITVPNDWQVVSLGEIACLRKGTVKAVEGDLLPYIALEHIKSNGTLRGCGKVSDSVSPKTAFCKGDTLYGKLRPNLRKVVRVDTDGVCSTDILAIYANDLVDGMFLSHLLRGDPLHEHAMKGIAGTRMPRTSWNHLQTFRLLLPPHNQQQDIARCLDSIDGAIERTESVVFATESLRDALLHELLTRGVPGWHTEWKNIPGIGIVPSDWKIYNFKDVADISFSPVDKKIVTGEVPVYLCNYTDVFYSRHIHSDMNFMSATAKRDECNKWGLRESDVLFTKDSETPTEIGIPSWVIEDMPHVLCGYHLGLARPNTSMISGSFLAKLLLIHGQKQFSKIANGVTRFGLTLEATRSILIPLPDVHEQVVIAAIIDCIDEVVECYSETAIDIINLKSSVSDILMTGLTRTIERGIADA